MTPVELSGNLADLGVALAKAQASIKGAIKDATNPHYKSKYADLASIWDAAREPLTKNGLSVVQLPGYEKDGNICTLTTILLHISGQWIKGVSGAPVAKPDAQGVGSAVTYLRRYSLAAVAGIAPEDDDGEAASRPARKESRPAPKADRPEWVNEAGEVFLPGKTKMWQGYDGKPLREVPETALAKALAALREKAIARYEPLIAAMEEELERRRPENTETLADMPRALKGEPDGLPFK